MTERICKAEGCGSPVGRKGGYGYCNPHYLRFRRHGDPLGGRWSKPRDQWPLCSVDGCRNTVRRGTAQWCEAHYQRDYKHGSVDMVAPGASARARSRYRTMHRASHPLAGPSGFVYEHRAVLYDAIGPGERQCHWCPAIVSWSISPPKRGALTVDHLNNDPVDNRPENLVAACMRCNVTRGSQRRHRALRAAGFWSRNDTLGREGRRRPEIENQSDGGKLARARQLARAQEGKASGGTVDLAW